MNEFSNDSAEPDIFLFQSGDAAPELADCPLISLIFEFVEGFRPAGTRLWSKDRGAHTAGYMHLTGFLVIGIMAAHYHEAGLSPSIVR